MEGLPHETVPVRFTVTGGAPVLVELSAPHRGTLNAIRIQQLDGAHGGKFRVFNNQAAALSIVEGSSSSEAFAGRPDNYAIMEEHTLVNGNFAKFEARYGYVNRDSQASGAVGKLWMIFTPDHSDDAEYEVTMTIFIPQM